MVMNTEKVRSQNWSGRIEYKNDTVFQDRSLASFNIMRLVLLCVSIVLGTEEKQP